MKFPTLCVDEFYKNPDEIREYALSLEYETGHGHYPGVRTKPLSEINPKFFSECTQKLFSLFFDFNYQCANWNVTTCFQKIYPYSDDPNDVLNNGWFHTDGDALAAAVIYLNPISNPEAGTSFGIPTTEINTDFSVRNELYKNDNLSDIDENLYRSTLIELNSNFVPILEVKNVYNRLIFYDSFYWHRETNFYASSKEPRLTQVFFIEFLDNENLPIKRMNQYTI